MRVALVTEDRGWHTRNLKKTFAIRGVEAVIVSLTQGVLDLSGHPLPVLFPGFEEAPPVGIFVRGVPGGTLEEIILHLDLLHVLEAAGIKVYNPTRVIEKSVDKGLCSFLLQQAGLPVPPTIMTRNREKALAWAEAEFSRGHTVVSKPLFGAQGEGVRWHRETTSLECLVPAGGVFYLQRYVGQLPARDVRVLVVGGRAVAAMIRIGAEGEWRTNIAQGACCEPALLTPQFRQLAERAVAALEMDYGGVDLIFDENGQPWILEVNGIPAWRGLQRVSPLDITALLVDDFLGHLKRRQWA